MIAVHGRKKVPSEQISSVPDYVKHTREKSARLPPSKLERKSRESETALCLMALYLRPGRKR